MRPDTVTIQLEDFEGIRDLIDAGELATAENALAGMTGRSRVGAVILQVRMLNFQTKWSEAQILGKLAVEQAMEANHPIWEVYARAEWVVPLWELGMWDQMVEIIRQAEVIIDGMNRDEKFPILFPLGQLNMHMGMYYMRKGMLETGVRYFRKSFFAYRNGREETRSAEQLSKIGLAYFGEGMYDGALLHQYEALNLFERFGAKFHSAVEWGQVAETHGAMHQYSRAVEAAERSLRYFRDTGTEGEVETARERLVKFQEMQEAEHY